MNKGDYLLAIARAIGFRDELRTPAQPDFVTTELVLVYLALGGTVDHDFPKSKRDLMLAVADMVDEEPVRSRPPEHGNEPPLRVSSLMLQAIAGELGVIDPRDPPPVDVPRPEVPDDA